MGIFGKKKPKNEEDQKREEKQKRSEEEEKKQAGLRQNLNEQAEFQNLFQMYLLFGQEAVKPATEKIKAALEVQFGEVDIVSGDHVLTAFAIKKYQVGFAEGALPAQVLMAEVTAFDQEKVSGLERTQLWDVPDGPEMLSRCSHSLMLSDFLSAALDYKERCDMLAGWLETAVSLFPDCLAVWIPSAGKLLTTEQVRNNPAEGSDRFIYLAVNGRFFNIEGTEDMLVDTLGLYAIGLPDVQYHFHGLEADAVINHAYNVAAYIFDANAPVKSGETIAGLDEEGHMNGEIHWRCQYEDSLIQPLRTVMDICPGAYASGGRG